MQILIMYGKLYIVATPIGNLSDMSFRAIEVLKSVELIAAEDTRHTRKLLTHFDIHTKLTSFFKGNENKKFSSLLEILKQGKDVALVSCAGTPCISDPGYPLLHAAVTEGITTVPIPGPSAIITALSAAGLSTDRFTFIGFLPDKPGKRKKVLEELETIEHTLVFYVSVWKVKATLDDLLEVLGDRNICIARELTKIHEEFIRGTISEILPLIESKKQKGEFVVLVEGR